MYIIRDVFQLQFGHFKAAHGLISEALEKSLLPDSSTARILSDFTGESYRLIFEESHESLATYEKELSESMRQQEWQAWYEKFKPHVQSSYREILKLITPGKR